MTYELLAPRNAQPALVTRRTVLSAVCAWAAAPAKAATRLPADSIYHLQVPLTDQQGRARTLDDHRGDAVVVGMFYTSCQFVCPMLLDTLHETAARLSTAQRSHLTLLMVSFDPQRDTVEVLKHTAEQRELDPARWTLARTDAASVRKLAAVLGIRYKALANGMFNHSTDLVLLDRDGRIAGRTAQLGTVDPAFVLQVQRAAQAAST